MAGRDGGDVFISSRWEDRVGGDPYLKCLTHEFMTKRCSNCFRKLDLEHGPYTPCFKCGTRYYCDDHCKKEDWKKGHLVECPMLETSISFRQEMAVTGADGDLRLLLLRLYAIFMVSNEWLDERGTPMEHHETPYQTFNELLLLQDTAGVTEGSQSKMLCYSMQDHFQRHYHEKPHDLDNFIRLILVIKTWRFWIKDMESGEIVGWGLHFVPVTEHPEEYTRGIGQRGLELQKLEIVAALANEEVPTNGDALRDEVANSANS